MYKKQKLRLSKPVTKSIDSIKKRTSIRVRLYMGIIVGSLLLISGVAFVKAYQALNISMIAVDTNPLEFESGHEITRWHDQEAKFVYLTFNDGPSENTEKIMNVLENHEIRGTFFVLGSAIEKSQHSETILRKMIDNGHYIGLHSMTRDINHLYRADQAPQNFLDEMLELQTLVSRKTGGYESSLCRAPLGTSGTLSEEHIEWLLKSDFHCWDWHIDVRDWSPVTVEEIMNHIETGMMLWRNPNHLVILLQESDVAIEALPEIIAYYRAKNYEFLPYNPSGHFPVNFINHPDL